MKKSGINRKRLTALSLSLLLVMQQSLMYQAVASIITDGTGSTIIPDAMYSTNGVDVYNIYPDAYKGDYGFRIFNDLKLGKDANGNTDANTQVMNFIFNWLDMDPNNYGNATDIKTFINLINNKAEIHGIVNALDAQGGNIKHDGNLMFISPNGVVVGPNGIINAGTLSILTPTQSTYNTYKTGIPNSATQNTAGGRISHSLAVELDNMPDLSVLRIDNQPIDVNGRIAARGDVNFQGGKITTTNGSQIYSGVGTGTYGTTNLSASVGNQGAAAALFSVLVNENAKTANDVSNNNGNIQFVSTQGIDLQNGSKLRNYNNNSTGQKIYLQNESTGTDGITIAGEMFNKNSNIKIENAAGYIKIDPTGQIVNGARTSNQNGSIIINSNGNNTSGIVVNGIITNNTEGNISFENDGGDQGIDFKSNAIVTNYKGNINVDSYNGDVDIEENSRITNGNGKIRIYNDSSDGDMIVSGIITNNYGNMSFENLNNDSALLVNDTAEITNKNGDMTFENNGKQMVLNGSITNKVGNMLFDNNIDHLSGGELSVGDTAYITSESNATGTTEESFGLKFRNYGDMDIRGIVDIRNAIKENTTKFVNIDGDMTIGANDGNNIISNKADVNIQVTNGNLYNNGIEENLIKTENGGDLNITVANGAIGKDVVGCDGGICTGIGRNARDITKSINASIDGLVTASSTERTNSSLVNIASLDKDMNVNRITADGRVILLADTAVDSLSQYDVVKTTGATPYNILNKAKDSTLANVEGAGISIIASGNIGTPKTTSTPATPFTIKQTGFNFGTVDSNLNYSSNATDGVDMLAQGSIDIKGLGTTTDDTNVCALVARGGDINADFAGSVYVGEVIAPGSNTKIATDSTSGTNIDIYSPGINITARGKELYVNHLGEAPNTYAESNGSTDYYGGKPDSPQRAQLTALDLGTDWDNRADSRIVVKNGTLNGNALKRPSHYQDLTAVADNVYAGGKYFKLGNSRGEIPNEDPSNPSGHKFNKSTMEDDNRTNIIKTEDGTRKISIRGKAVRPEDDVVPIGEEADRRNYYYGGSSQGNDTGYDGVDNNGDLNPQGGSDNDDDNLVDPKEVPIDTDSDTDTDIDTDLDSDLDTDIDSDTDLDADSDTDTDTDADTDTDIDSDTDLDTDTDTDDDYHETIVPLDTDTDTDIDTDTDTDVDNDNDNDTDIDSDTDLDADSDTDTDTDADSDTDIDSDTDLDTDTDTDDDYHEIIVPLDTDTDTDIDTDTDTDVDNDNDNDTDIDSDTDLDADSDTDTDTDADSDTDIDSDTDLDTDTDTDDDYKEEIVIPLDTDTDTDIDTDTDTDVDNDNDNDTDVDSDTDLDADSDTDTDIDADTDTDIDSDTDVDTDSDTDDDYEPEPDIPNIDFSWMYNQRVVSDFYDAIDKRQFIRYSAEYNQNPVVFESTKDVIAVKDLSRGGLLLKHDNTLKVGDIVPIHLKYGDLEVNADVKVVSATDAKAGAEFINLDEATANRLLYLNMLITEDPTKKLKK